ncbi:MAG: M48 family metalloprotease [Desulforhopalus sp.]
MKKLTTLIIVLSLTLCGCNSIHDVSSTLTSITGDGNTFEGKFLDERVANIEDRSLTTSESKKEIADIKFRAVPDMDLVESECILSYLNGIKQKLIEQWPLDLSHDVSLKITTARTYSALSTPWEIVISMGILADVESEDELVFIIAHELSHILLDHHDSNEYFKSQAELVRQASEVAALEAKIEDVKVVRSGHKVNFHQQNSKSAQQKIVKAYKTKIIINRLSKDVISSSMTRDDEKEADLLGVDLMVKAGYSAFGYGKAMERLKSSQVFTQEQLRAKRADFQEFTMLLTADYVPDGDEFFKNILFESGNSVIADVLQVFAKRHPDPEMRSLTLAKYVKREYRKERRRALQTEKLLRVLREGRGEVVLNNYWRASEALRAVDSGDLKQAEALARLATSGLTSRHAFPRVVFSSVRNAQGKSEQAIKNLNLIDDWNNASTQTFLMAAQSYKRAGMYDKALSVLTKAESSLGIHDALYPEYISIYQTAGRKEEALAIMDQCQQVTEKAIHDLCQRAAGTLSIQQQPAGVEKVLNSLKNALPVYR